VYPGPAPLLVWLGIPGIAAALAVLFVFANRCAAQQSGLAADAVRRRTRAAALLVLGWCALQGAAAGSGLLARFDARPPPLALFLPLVVAGAVAFGVSRFAAPLVSLPLARLVGFQAFRLPLELVMHEAGRAGVMPTLLSFSGANFDIVTGTLAIPVALLAAAGRAPRALILAWNALGIAALLVIAGIAVGTAPFVQAFGPAQVNAWVSYLPFVYLPGVMVAAAIAGHVLVLRRLYAAPNTSR
jgi:hypothetical protein